MRHFPNSRPARLAGLEHCVEHARRRPVPVRAWLLLAVGAAAFCVGFAAIVLAWRAAP